MIEKTEKNEVILSQFLAENLKFHERTSSENSMKSHKEFSTEFNEKNNLKEVKEEKLKRF